MNEIYQDIGKEIETRSVDLGQAVPKMTDQMLRTAGISIKLSVPELQKKTVQSWFDSSQIEGLYFNDWLKKLSENTVARIVKETRESIVLHEPIRETAKRIQAALDVGRRSAEGLAQTSYFQATSWAEREYHAENQKSLKGLRYVTELDRRTCPKCAPLDGRIFPIESAPQPPIHWKCRCHLEPVWKNAELEKFTGDQTRIARIDTEGRTVKHRASTGGGTSTKYENLR